MRQLSFKGFLSVYLRELSGQESLSISKLAHMAKEEMPRLREPLFLYAAISGKAEILSSLAEKHGLTETYKDVSAFFCKNAEECLEKGRLPEKYQKVYSSFKAKRDRLLTDNATKELMRKKILALKEKKQITNYRLYTDLELNCGNVNAWLKHGGSGLVSLETARRILSYAETAI